METALIGSVFLLVPIKLNLLLGGYMGSFEMKVFSGSSNPEFAQKVCQHLEIEPGKALVKKFSDGETRIEIGENVRGADVFVIQSGAPPYGNDYIMEMLIMIDALKRASAKRITAVMPYYPYGRQDRKDKPRVPITARLVADLIQTAGAARVLTMELHAGQIQGFFDIPVDHLYGSPILIPYIREQWDHNLVIVSPDAGGVKRARSYAKHLGVELAMIDKRRVAANEAEVMNIIGDVAGKRAMVLDDMIDTAGTIVKASAAVLEKGAREVCACGIHAVFSGQAVPRIYASPIQKVVVGDTIPLSVDAEDCEKIEAISVASVFAKAMKAIHLEDGITSLFEVPS